LGATLRGAGLVSTTGRRHVLGLIEASELPLSHADVMARLRRDIADRATVYRILNELARVGLARRVDLGDRIWRFAAPTRAPSALLAMFTCTRCHNTSALVEIELHLPRKAPRALRQGDVQIYLRGPCDDCL
jgi:Fe2+ or Zn2+ uptake regulation protein